MVSLLPITKWWSSIDINLSIPLKGVTIGYLFFVILTDILSVITVWHMCCYMNKNNKP
jgi:hypothetical protein